MVILSMMEILVMDVIYIYMSTYDRNPYENGLMSFPYGKTNFDHGIVWQSGTILGSKKRTCRLIHSKENYGPLIPPSQCCHTTLPGKAFQKKTAISVRMPAYIGHHWSRRGIRCDVTKCRRMAFFLENPVWQDMQLLRPTPRYSWHVR